MICTGRRQPAAIARTTSGCGRHVRIGGVEHASARSLRAGRDELGEVDGGGGVVAGAAVVSERDAVAAVEQSPDHKPLPGT
jgi:hypothetical protein